ncbi:MAG TPA: RNA polymerase subunit sigma [Flavobacteriales bacterium]|nr:RNA polymerase subunit sigma [Flavobacteriales bacterium]
MTAIEFNQHVIMMRPRLKAFAVSLTSDQEDAKDLLQDTILKAFTYREKFTDSTNLGAWLFTIMKNTFINNYRRRKKADRKSVVTKDLHFVNIPQTKGSISPESTYSENELLKGISELSDEYRIPFNMHLEGHKYKDIADEVGVPIGTVKSRIFLARQILMKKFKDYRYN